MDGYRMYEAARVTGFTVSALRFYEQEGVVVPERTATGYRSYREDHLEALRFVGRGKQLGLSLDEISELLALLDREECEPVQTRILQLVTRRIHQAQEQIAELAAFTAQLQRVYRICRGGIATLSQARQHPASVQRTRRRGLGPRWRRNRWRADAPTALQTGCGWAVRGPRPVSLGLEVKD